MTNIDVKKAIKDKICEFWDKDKENERIQALLDKIMVFESDEFAGGAKWLHSSDFRLVYDYYDLIMSMREYGYSDAEAEDWLDYNTKRSIPYWRSKGLIAPEIKYYLNEQPDDISDLIPLFA